MEFTREQYENLPARQTKAFKDFLLRRFCDYTKFTKVYPETGRPAVVRNEPLVVDSPVDSGGWGGWEVDEYSLFTNDDYFTVVHYLHDERAPVYHSKRTKLPKDFVFGELEKDAEYQEYLRLKAKYE